MRPIYSRKLIFCQNSNKLLPVGRWPVFTTYQSKQQVYSKSGCHMWSCILVLGLFLLLSLSKQTVFIPYACPGIKDNICTNCSTVSLHQKTMIYTDPKKAVSGWEIIFFAIYNHWNISGIFDSDIDRVVFAKPDKDSN